jgi:hypothetical protein
VTDNVEVLTTTDSALYEEYTETKEKVKAFQFEGPQQVRQVVMAFLTDDRNWTLACRSGKYTLTFPAPPKKPAKTPVNSESYVGTVTLVPSMIASGSYYDGNLSGYVSEGITITQYSWVVERWSGTEHAEMTVMNDKDFRRKYR